MSPDLFTHSVSYFAEAPLAHHNPDRVKHIVYSCVPKVRKCWPNLGGRVDGGGGGEVEAWWSIVRALRLLGIVLAVVYHN